MRLLTRTKRQQMLYRKPGLTDETVDEVAVALDASGETVGYVVTVNYQRRLWR